MAESDTKDLDALLDSLNTSAERFQTLWFSFLGLTLYLAIAALATTHRDLLLNNPQTLPILNIKVELLPFYVVAPLLYLVFHFYLLMMLALLARTAAEFDKQLRTTLPGKAEQERYRAQVGNALFLQLLVGMEGERWGFNAFLLGLIALITIVLAPLLTIVLMQMMFLPYHHLRITWLHRGIVVADLVMIVVMTYRCFFPRGFCKAPLVLGALSYKPRWAAGMAFCALLAFGLYHLVNRLSFGEGRWAGEPRPASIAEWGHWMEGKPPSFPEVNPDYAATANGLVFGLFPDRLQLPNETIVGKEKLEKTQDEMKSRGGDFIPTINLDGRDLQAADLHNADLRGVSLDGATVRGAILYRARLDGARLSCERPISPCAQLQGADLSGAHLNGAYLWHAQLQSANLDGALLWGANLFRAQLQGADLQAQLQAAHLGVAKLGGADLRQSQLQATNLGGAQLQGANLSGVPLQSANLQGAQLQGADLRGAYLQGANLSGAGLQGADLSGADMTGSQLDGTFVWRTKVADTNLSDALIRDVHGDQVKRFDNGATIERLDEADVDRWIGTATLFPPANRANAKEEIVKRFDRLKERFQTPNQDTSDVAKWQSLEDSYRAGDPTGKHHRQRLAKILGDLACAPDAAPYVARNLIDSARLPALGDQLEGVRKRMKDGREKPEACSGIVGFTEEDWQKLDGLKSVEAAPADQ